MAGNARQALEIVTTKSEVAAVEWAAIEDAWESDANRENNAAEDT